ncbi:MAG: hypothetical protein M0R80_27355, partial [Proteobacteria bacterium]|nr:hypothetical protein [Pseudomonadota bacterium]
MPGRRAAAALCGMAALTVLVSACGLDHDRDTPPALVLSPATALQGASLTVLLTAPGVPLAQCQSLSGESLEFTFSDAPSQIEAATLEAIDGDTLRARLLVSMDAVPGDHLVVLRCDPRTDLNGIFSVRERVGPAAITLEPPEVKAGSYSFQIDIFGEEVAFSEELSHAVFGDGTHVTVSSYSIPDGMSQMTVKVDVDPLTPEGPMEVGVVTGDLVALGEIEILPRDTPWLLVEPDSLTLNADSVPAQSTHVITGNSIAFEEPEPDAGAEEGGTVVSFPENPGLHVANIAFDALDPSRMTITVLAEQGAALGTTPLTVETGGEIVSAAFTVYPPGGGAAFLTLSPSHLPRGASATTVLANGHFAAPFTTGDPGAEDAAFDEDGCHLEKLERLSATALAADVSVDGDFDGKACTLRLETSSGQLVGKLAIVAPLAPTLSGFTTIAQGAQNVWIAVSSVEVEGVEPVIFDAESTAAVGLRSGVGVVLQTPFDGGKSLLVIISRVAEDAPVGEATLRVVDDGAEYVVEYSVIPSEETPSNIIAAPGTVVGGMRSVSFDLESVGADGDGAMEFDAGAPPEIEFDTPAIRASSVEVLDAHNAVVGATVLPSVDVDTAVMYVISGGRKAAASFRVLPESRATATAGDPEITRGSKEKIVFVGAKIRADFFGAPEIVGEVFEGAGIDVLSVDLYPDNTAPLEEDELYLQLRVASDGPAGWLGVILTDGRETAVLPLHVAGTTDTLTMAMTAATADGALRPGDVGVAVSAILPAAAAGGGAPPEARSVSDGVHARLDAIDGTGASLLVDVGDDFEPAEEGAPIAIAVLTGKGAAIGFAPYVSCEAAALNEATPVELYLEPAASPVARVDADPAASFSFALASVAEPGHADATLSLLAEDALSSQGESSEQGLIWFAGSGDVQRLLVRPDGDTAGLPTAVRLLSHGAALTYATEDELPTALGDPCVAPTLVAGEIGAPLDDDWYVLEGASSCRVTAAVLARALGDRAWATPDALLALHDNVGGVPLLDESAGWPTESAPDPRLTFSVDSAHSRLLRVAPELASAGVYLLNLRRDGSIREICGGDGSAPAFIEIDIGPGVDLAA